MEFFRFFFYLFHYLLFVAQFQRAVECDELRRDSTQLQAKKNVEEIVNIVKDDVVTSCRHCTESRGITTVKNKVK